MTRIWKNPHLTLAFVGLLVGLAWQNMPKDGSGERSDVLAQQVDTSPDLSAIQRDIAELKAKVPDQAHSMMDVDYHFSNLWFAGKAENWPLAEFYWKETVSHMKWAVRIIPVRKDSAGKEIQLDVILKAIEESPFMQVGKTIENKSVTEFETAYRFTLEGCYSCHKASDKPYLRPQIPERPASAIINFDPQANWPR